MAEQVNQRIEGMINELEQMRRTTLYSDDEIKQISHDRKDFEYQLQRHVKKRQDYTQYISYELALLEDISNRRKTANMTEKKKDIEYAIAKRLNKIFKQFIYRFQNEVQVYFEYLKFCKSVGFNSAASGMIGQMLQMHGDKPEMWLLASKWESEEHNNVEAARAFLLKGLQRHSDSECLYTELFKTELLLLIFNTENEEEKAKLKERADVVWRNGLKNLNQVSFLFNCLDLILKYDLKGDIKSCIKQEIWNRRDKKEVWPYIAEKELEGCHWEEIEESLERSTEFSEVVNNCIAIYEEALEKFPDEKLFTKYIHTLLGLEESVCEESQKISAVKRAWKTGYELNLLTNDMFAFGIQLLKLEGETSDEKMWEVLNNTSEKHSRLRCVWAEKLLLSKSDERKMMDLLQQAINVLNADDAIYLYKFLIDNIKSKDSLQSLVEKLRKCENNLLSSIKPNLLQKMYDHNGLKAARELYNELITIPPVQLEVNLVMIDIEELQDQPNIKQIRKYYECAIIHHGTSNCEIWNKYINFESVFGEAVMVPSIFRRALAMLQPELNVEFINNQTMYRAS